MRKKRPGWEDELVIHIRIPKEVHKKLRIRVAEEDTTMQEWVAAQVEVGLESARSERAD